MVQYKSILIISSALSSAHSTLIHRVRLRTRDAVPLTGCADDLRCKTESCYQQLFTLKQTHNNIKGSTSNWHGLHITRRLLANFKVAENDVISYTNFTIVFKTVN